MQETDLTQSASTPATPETWEQLGLSEATLELIRNAGFATPSPVQAQAIPVALEGRDLIVSSQTGSGKTAAFALPMIERFTGREGTFGLVLAPTREIVQQIQATIELFGKPRGVRSICLIGGIDMRIDAQAIDTYPQIIVATPGRLCDHLDRGNVWLDFIQCVVLDEADRMLDMGFSDQLARIMEDVPKVRQTMLFSATIPPSVDRLAQKILDNPHAITIGAKSSAVKTVEQRLVWTTEEKKKRDLMRILEQEKGSIIVFTRSKDGATRLWRSLHSAGIYDATYIHSDRLQSHREQALADFKKGTYRILIATDVAARGIHVDAVAHVVNYDLPMESEDYVHRIGRTGRMGETGRSTTLATPRDRSIIGRIQKLIGRPIQEIELRSSRPPRGDRPEKAAPHLEMAEMSEAPELSADPQLAEGEAKLSESSNSGESAERGEEQREERGERGGRRRRGRGGRRGRGQNREDEAVSAQSTQSSETGESVQPETSTPSLDASGEPQVEAPAQPPKNPRKITLPPRPDRQERQGRNERQELEASKPQKKYRQVLRVTSSLIVVDPRDPSLPPAEPREYPLLESRKREPAATDWSQGPVKPFPVD